MTTADGRPPTDAPRRRHADGSWRIEVTSGYRTGNDRFAGVGPCATPTTDPPVPDPDVLPLPTPTTPTIGDEAPTAVDPPWLTGEESAVVAIEHHCRRRLVHRATGLGGGHLGPPAMTGRQIRESWPSISGRCLRRCRHSGRSSR
ncbi:hypothetical protein [Actinoallomurus sp. CA-142502]|uniref:hypothetical protein n=1 Tax=Actinoallomurus sp. CA-142502 TaxID=3239885 RepID=UPI003D8FF7B1